jgi:multisubunit Na+/H+ antiporter MnhF subunit
MNQATQMIDALAQRFGATGAELWLDYQHATQINAAVWLVTISMLSIALYRMVARIKWEDDFIAVKYFVVALILVIAACGVAANVTDLFYPQGTSLHYLIGK